MVAEVAEDEKATRELSIPDTLVPQGKLASFPLAVECREDETVVISWVSWPSRAARDEGMKKFMQDERMQTDKNPMPFDGARMVFGGFRQIVGA